jgi:hypothetical protein
MKLYKYFAHECQGERVIVLLVILLWRWIQISMCQHMFYIFQRSATHYVLWLVDSLRLHIYIYIYIPVAIQLHCRYIDYIYRHLYNYSMSIYQYLTYLNKLTAILTLTLSSRHQLNTKHYNDSIYYRRIS